MRKRLTCFILLLLSFMILKTDLMAQSRSGSDDHETRYLILRADDFGMTHAANQGLLKLIETGIPFSASVMFPTPWYQEAIEILKENPQVSRGIHLTLNSEWRSLKWGPVSGQDAVPSLVDENGFFFGTVNELMDNNPDPKEVEHEFRAQIKRALNSGLTFDYMDFHMGAAVRTPEFRSVTESLAKEFGLALSRYFGEESHSPRTLVFPDDFEASLEMFIKNLKPGYNLVVAHVGLDTDEMAALTDLNPGGVQNMSRHRYGELVAYTSEVFLQKLKDAGVRLINYREIIDREGLEPMGLHE